MEEKKSRANKVKAVIIYDPAPKKNKSFSFLPIRTVNSSFS